MNKCSAFILACAFGLLTAERVEASPVEWDFIAPSCVDGPCAGAALYPSFFRLPAQRGLALAGPATIRAVPRNGKP
jgi:hypothetical protein